MKTKILFLLLFIPLNILAQRGETAELYMWTSEFSPTTEVNFYLDACGPIWDEDKDITTVDTLLHSIVNIPEVYTWGTMSHGDDWHNGWDFVTIISEEGRPNYGWGLYKVSTSASESFFYIDFRDDRWPDYDLPVNGAKTDIYLRYDKDDEDFEYSSGGGTGWVDISDGEYLTLWEIKQKGDPSVGNFEDYWTNCLNITYNSNGNPRIVWGPHPSFSPLTGYKIYRANTEGEDPDPPDPGDYSLHTTLNSSTLSYVDTDVRLDDFAENITWYYVKAYYEHPKTHNITYSSATNIVNAYYVEFYKPFGEKESIISNYSPKLYQNYPNPFNPTTNISFDLPKESTVQLQIYDIQGKLVSTLVNETMDEGTHSVSYNSSGLPSGVYFYRLSTKNFTDIKRMLLLK